MKIATHLSANVSIYAQHARFIFSTRKNMAAHIELISQMVTYLHTGSHIKPGRVKIHMQMKAGRKGHKNNKRWLLCVLFASDKNWLEGKQRSV